MKKILFSIILLGCPLLKSAEVEKKIHMQTHLDEKLIQAIMNNKVDEIEPLLNQGADVNGIRDNIVPLCFAINSGNKKIIKILLEYKANINKPGWTSRKTPLIKAARENYIETNQKGYIDIIKLLIENKSDLNAQDAMGKTALLHAKEIKNTEIVELLLDARADTTIADKFGTTFDNYESKLEKAKASYESHRKLTS